MIKQFCTVACGIGHLKMMPSSSAYLSQHLCCLLVCKELLGFNKLKNQSVYY